MKSNLLDKPNAYYNYGTLFITIKRIVDIIQITE